MSHILGVTTMRVRFFPLLIGLSLCGCATIQDYQYNFVQRIRADHAYKENHGLWNHCSRHYQDGWKQGYFDLSTGQCEEPPATPPHKYWDARYQSLEGREIIGEWYSGWQDGATAAVQDGRPYFHPVVASPTAPAPNHGPHTFHGGGGDDGMEVLPPAPPTHDPQPQVHVGPSPQKFANQTIDGDELLDEASLPVYGSASDDAPADDQGYGSGAEPGSDGDTGEFE